MADIWVVFVEGFRDLLSSNEINVSSSNSKRRELKLGGGKKEGIRALNTCWHKLAFVGKLRPNIDFLLTELTFFFLTK